MPNIETHKLYGGEVELLFYPDSHRFKMAGERSFLLGVTSVTGVINKSDVLVPWAVGLAVAHVRRYLEESTGPYTIDELLPVIADAARAHDAAKYQAASIGDQVHGYAEAFATSRIAKAMLPKLPTDADEKVLNGINAFLGWVTANDVAFQDAERLVMSRRFRYAGILDAIATVNGKLTLIDYKTTKAIYDEARFQVAGYLQAYTEETDAEIEQVLILNFSKETGELTELRIPADENMDRDFPVFRACLEIKQRQRELDAARRIT